MRLKSYKFRFSKKPAAFCRTTLPDPARVEIATRKEIPAEDDSFIGAKEAAAWLGIPLRSLNQYVRQGLLPSYKLGKHRLFRKKQLLDALGMSHLSGRGAILR